MAALYLLQEPPRIPQGVLQEPTFVLSPHKWCSNPSFPLSKQQENPTKKSFPVVLLACSGPWGPCSRLAASLEEWGVPHQVNKYAKGLHSTLEAGFLTEKAFPGRGTPLEDSTPFNVVLFQDPEVYESLSSSVRASLRGRKLLFYSGCSTVSLRKTLVLPDNSTVSLEPLRSLRNLRLPSLSLNILKTPRILYETMDPSGYLSIKTTNTNSFSVLLEGVSDAPSLGRVPLVVSLGDNVILFGMNPLEHWLTRLLAMDALGLLTNSTLFGSLRRSILLDIDDIFVGRNRLSPKDVRSLLDSQARLRGLVKGFTYNLGFSGGTYGVGEGDEALLEAKEAFWWFPHSFKHLQPHLFNSSASLVRQMRDNAAFAQKVGLSVPFSYAVSPHHSGVYPPHPPLFEAWRRVWNISVTSTEEYPHLKPPRYRRGFVFEGISVLPRQTCGLFTKNTHYADYPKSPEVLERSLRGGELFNTLLVNPYNVYMSHMPNYAFDRLAPYAFESVFSLVTCATNLRLECLDPESMAKAYFETFPEEKTPLWGNPCSDPRHAEIVPSSPNGSCPPPLPQVLIIGPQKTGSTALYTFMKIHPGLSANEAHPETFEELQFFSRETEYIKGIHYYASFWKKDPKGPHHQLRFEKSATYFDKDSGPKRAFSLLPGAKIIALIISPLKRALSWYHHARAHGDPAALGHSLFEVLSFESTRNNSIKGSKQNNASTRRALRSLRSRILEPGKYAVHLKRWLKYYHEKDVLILDGEKLRHSAGSALNSVQRFLGLHTRLDYEKELVYDPKKGFYCQMIPDGRPKCLGKNKGRSYPSLDEASRSYLKKYYRPFNEDLKSLLYQLDFSVPYWLLEDLENDT